MRPAAKRPVRRIAIVAGLLIPAAWIMTAPARAEIDLSGDWAVRIHSDNQDRTAGPELGDYTALPVNDAARALADTWDASRLSLQEHQCMSHMIPYMSQAPFPFRITMVRDPDTQRLIAIKFYYQVYEQTQTVWMDGRPHPSKYAKHSNMGFSTGKWERDMLTVYTTHIKQGWTRRNGIAQSADATLTEHWMRHGDYLSHVSIMTDPAYLTEPYIRTDDFALEPRTRGLWLYACEATKDEIAGRPRGYVPSFLFGENPYLKAAQVHGITAEEARGGAEEMYPEYQLKLKKMESDAAAKKSAP
jgi:hypothetical protein